MKNEEFAAAGWPFFILRFSFFHFLIF